MKDQICLIPPAAGWTYLARNDKFFCPEEELGVISKVAADIGSGVSKVGGRVGGNFDFRHQGAWHANLQIFLASALIAAEHKRIPALTMSHERNILRWNMRE